MRVLIVADIEKLNSLRKELPNHIEFVENDRNAYMYDSGSTLCICNTDDEKLNICFGDYYTEVPENDKRWSCKNGICDLLVEYDTDKMKFLCGGGKYAKFNSKNTTIDDLVEYINDTYLEVEYLEDDVYDVDDVDYDEETLF